MSGSTGATFRTKVRSITIVLVVPALVLFCSTCRLPSLRRVQSTYTQQHPAELQRKTRRTENDGTALALKDAAPFPVGTVWSSGHATWSSLNKGTDLGGPSAVFDPGTFMAEFNADFSTIVQKQLEEEAEHRVLQTQFNSITPEVALKPHNVAAAGPHDLDFAEADAMMAFARAQGLRVHGHVLLFHQSIPQWALEYETNHTWTPQQWHDWLRDYILTVVGRYQGRIASWDVLNEVASPFGGPLRTDSSFWWRVIGDDYVAQAFQWAAEADPEAKLFINENLLDFLPDKLRLVLDLANDLRRRGVKVDGIGLQGHLLDGILQGGYAHHRRAYATVSDEGYLVHLSELDVAVNVVGLFYGAQNFWQHWAQRRAYNNVARAYRDGVAPQNQWGITVWNVADPNSFLNIVKFWFDVRFFGGPEYPLLWDADYNPKPAYYGFRNGLQGVVEGWFWPIFGDTD